MPAVTGSGVSVLTIERLATGLTVVVMLVVLLAGVRSGLLLVTMAVLVITPATVGVTTIVMLLLPPAPILPRLLQVTVPLE